MRTKTITQLKGTLRQLGIGILGEILSAQTLKSCSTTAPQVRNYLAELGYTVSSYGGGGGYSDHFDLGVLTRTGWYSVDPTFMQFHCRYQGEDVTPESTDPRVQAFFRHLYAILKDGLNAFEIIKVEGPLKPDAELTDSERRYQRQLLGYLGGALDPPLYSAGTWAAYWQDKGRRAVRRLDRLAAGTPYRRDTPGTYPAMLWEWMQLHNKRLPDLKVEVLDGTFS